MANIFASGMCNSQWTRSSQKSTVGVDDWSKRRLNILNRITNNNNKKKATRSKDYRGFAPSPGLPSSKCDWHPDRGTYPVNLQTLEEGVTDNMYFIVCEWFGVWFDCIGKIVAFDVDFALVFYDNNFCIHAFQYKFFFFIISLIFTNNN